MTLINDYITLARPKHWIKNVLIFVPCLFGGTILKKETIVALLITFVSFSLIASSIYYINDIKDVSKDKLHDIKKNRPIASGRVSILSASVIAIFLAAISVVILAGYFKGATRIKIILVLLTYFLVNLFYSFGLKNQPIIDVMSLAAGFVLRVVYGSIATGVAISQWLLLTILMFSLYMGLGKRRNELRKVKNSMTRSVLKYYSDEYLSRIMLLTMSLGLVFYSLWASLIVKQGIIMVWTVPLVISILMKYELNVEQDNFGDPVEVLTHDKIIFTLLALYVFIVFVVLYIL